MVEFGHFVRPVNWPWFAEMTWGEGGISPFIVQDYQQDTAGWQTLHLLCGISFKHFKVTKKINLCAMRYKIS